MSDPKPLLTVVLALLSTAELSAQAPAPPAPTAADPYAAKLDQILARWEKQSTSTKSLVAEVECTRKNNVFNRTEKLTGAAKFMQQSDGSYLARLDLKSAQNPERYERFICTGSHIYMFRPDERAIYVYALPTRRQNQPPDEGPMPFLFGMKAETAKKRYQFKILKEDQYYTYIEVKPNFPKDQAEFTSARVVVWKDSFLPRQIYYVEPNKIEVTWDINRIQFDVLGPEHRREFMKPTLPPGWRWQTEQTLTEPSANPPPIKVRPQEMN